jgi:hypothetical protein
MQISRRQVVAVLLLLLVFAAAGWLFWPFIYADILRPTALVLWLFLRIFVLSVGQKYYWGAVVFAGLIFLIRLLPKEQVTEPEADFFETNATLKAIGYWRSLFFTPIPQDVRSDGMLKQELTRLLLALYATKQRTSADFRLYEALQRGEIPLPERIHAFLFPEKPKAAGSSLRKLIQTARERSQKWFRRWTGQEAREQERMIAEVLSFMETMLEMKNDAGKFNPH